MSSLSTSSTSIHSNHSSSSGESVFTYTSFGYDIPDLTVPDEFSDAILSIEGHCLYTCRGILASASPVFRQVLSSKSKESDSWELELPGKNFDHMHELLQCISPAIQKPISDINVDYILPLADEYQMGKLKSDCESWLLHQLKSRCILGTTDPRSESDRTKDVSTIFHYLQIAQKFNLPLLQDQATMLISSLEVSELEARPEYQTLDSDTVVQILKYRVQSLEKSTGKSKRTIDFWRNQCEELEEIVKRMGREKITIKRVLDELEVAWDVKSPDTRCIDPVHIYCPRIYACEKCTNQIQTFMKSKINFLLNKGSDCSGIKWPH